MKAVILAGGRGSRLMPFTEDLPKPLLPVAGSPILDYVTAQLKHYCVEEEILTLGYKAQLICDYVSGYRGIKRAAGRRISRLEPAAASSMPKSFWATCF